jgi:hypothetical protein
MLDLLEKVPITVAVGPHQTELLADLAVRHKNPCKARHMCRPAAGAPLETFGRC